MLLALCAYQNCASVGFGTFILFSDAFDSYVLDVTGFVIGQEIDMSCMCIICCSAAIQPVALYQDGGVTMLGHCQCLFFSLNIG